MPIEREMAGGGYLHMDLALESTAPSMSLEVLIGDSDSLDTGGPTREPMFSDPSARVVVRCVL